MPQSRLMLFSFHRKRPIYAADHVVEFHTCSELRKEAMFGKCALRSFMHASFKVIEIGNSQ